MQVSNNLKQASSLLEQKKMANKILTNILLRKHSKANFMNINLFFLKPEI